MWGTFSFRFIRLIQLTITFFGWPYRNLYSFTVKKRKVPSILNPVLTKKASELAQMIRERKISSTTVVQAYIERIKIVNPIINCVVQDRFNEALKEAKEVDKMIEANPDSTYWARTKPLLGVPISIKETIGVKGLSQNGGRLRPREAIAQEDGVAVKNLRDAGAIPTVVTNTPEMCFFWESYNYAIGITKNPYNTQRTAGGSSGGEAALLGAGGSVIGFGSDIAGSGRIPPSYCGVFGHKPTSRLISIQGHMPSSPEPEWDKFLVYAPLARSASDLKLLFRCAAPEETDNLKLEEPIDIKTLQVYYLEECRSPMISRIDPEVKASVKKAAMYFKKYGIEPTKVTIKDMDKSLEACLGMILSLKSPQNVFQRSEDTDDWTMGTVIWELLRKLVGCGRVTLYSVSFGFLKRYFEAYSKEKIDECINYKERLTKYFEDLLGDNGVLILPVMQGSADKHFGMYSKLFEVFYSCIFNLLEMPATACPVGFDRNGMPLGIQIVANKFQDRLTLAAAQVLEEAYGGWIPPSKEPNINIV